MLTPWKESYDQRRQHIQKQRHYLANKGPSSQGYGFSSGHVWIWELDCEESWALKNWCFSTVVLEKTLASPFDAKAETPILWPPRAKSWLIGKDPDAGRDWGQEEKGMTEAEMAVWHHGLDGRESEWTLGVGDEQGGLACCDSWGCKESETTERLNWTELKVYQFCSVWVSPTVLSSTQCPMTHAVSCSDQPCANYTVTSLLSLRWHSVYLECPYHYHCLEKSWSSFNV